MKRSLSRVSFIAGGFQNVTPAIKEGPLYRWFTERLLEMMNSCWNTWILSSPSVCVGLGTGWLEIAAGCVSLCLFPHKWTPVILTSITRCTFVLLRVSAVIDVQAFERLLGSCKEIMKRNIAHYEEQLVALFGSSMDLRDWASHTTLCAFYYDVTTYTMTHRRTQTIWAQIKLLHESGRPRRSWLTCTCINTYTVWMHLYTHHTHEPPF